MHIFMHSNVYSKNSKTVKKWAHFCEGGAFIFCFHGNSWQLWYCLLLVNNKMISFMQIYHANDYYNIQSFIEA